MLLLQGEWVYPLFCFINVMDIKQSIIEEAVLKLARQVAEEQGIEVIGANLFGRGRRMLLRVTIDKDGGVTLDDCERFSRSFESLLEAEDPIQNAYTLEVSSPGLDRPLTTVKDFERNIGRLARIITKEKIDNQNFFIGRIISVTGNMIKLDSDKKEREIPFENISKARLKIEIK